MAFRRKAIRRKRSKVYRRGRVSRRRLQPSSVNIIPQALHTRFSAVGKRRRTGPFSGTGPRSSYGAAAYTQTKSRKRTAPVNAMQELTKSTKRVRMQKYKMSRVVRATVNSIVSRFQLLSNFDTNVGARYLDNYQYTTGAVGMPMCIFDLGSISQPSLAIPAPAALSQPFWTGSGPSANLSLEKVIGQNPDGTTSTVYDFQFENNIRALSYGAPPTAPTNDTPTAILDWVSLRLNLYGQRNRTTKFVVTIFQITDDEVDPINGDSNGLDRKALFQYLERPFIFSNLQQDWKGKKTGFKTIKEFTYNVAPMTSIDLNTTTGNIHEANIKVQINKRLDYSYTKSGASILGHTQLDGLDYNQNLAINSLYQSPKPKQNVFVAIRAFAPVRTYQGAVSPQLPRSAENCPSFDVIVRRGMTLPS